MLDPDLERILALRPDLVVTYATQVDLQQQLERAKVPIFNYSHAGLPDVMQTMRQLGARVGRPQEADKVALEVEAALAEIRRRTAERPRPRVLLVFSRDAGALRGIYASGGVGFLHDMLEAAGGSNVFADVASAVRAGHDGADSVEEARRDSRAARHTASEQESRAQTRCVEGARLAFRRSARIASISSPTNARWFPDPAWQKGTRLLAATLHPDAFR